MLGILQVRENELSLRK